jgi:hypothetical protein
MSETNDSPLAQLEVESTEVLHWKKQPEAGDFYFAELW